jgi:hypothetical protein
MLRLSLIILRNELIVLTKQFPFLLLFTVVHLKLNTSPNKQSVCVKQYIKFLYQFLMQRTA